MGSGAAVGAAAGGPVGFIVGAAVGAWLGDQYHRQHRARAEFEQNWMESDSEVTQLNGLLNDAEREVSSVESQMTALETRLHGETRQLQRTVREALDIQVLFRTNEDTVPAETQRRLKRLATALKGLDDTLVRIEGHADSRGASEHNVQLSAQRAAAVRDTLISAGVPAARISVDAYGEQHSTAVEGDLDALALERLVRLTLMPEDDEARVARE